MARRREFENYIDFINQTLQIPEKQPYLALDLFAGCGGLSLGIECAGINTIGYEMNEDCCATYENNLHSVCNRGVLSVNSQFPNARIVLGGPPCQPFSRRGRRAGAEDARNGFPAFIEAIRQINPDIWVCENVKGLPEQNREYYEAVVRELHELGYEHIEETVVRMRFYDVGQNRERLILVGHRGGFDFPEEGNYTITSGEALGPLAFEAPENGVYLTPAQDEYIATYEAASHCATPRDLHLDKPARTLTCRNLAGATSDMMRIRLQDGRRRRITVREAARLQSFPDWFEFSGNEESQFTQIGNAVPPMFAYHLGIAIRKYLEVLDGVKI